MIYALLLLQAAAAPVCATDPMLGAWAAAPVAATLTPPGKPVTLTGTDPAVAPTKPGKVATANFTVPKGTYTIALTDGAWIDVVSADGATISSTAHGHNPCTTAKKYVAFALAGGSYTLKLSGIQGPSIKAVLLAGDQTPKGMH